MKSETRDRSRVSVNMEAAKNATLHGAVGDRVAVSKRRSALGPVCCCSSIRRQCPPGRLGWSTTGGRAFRSRLAPLFDRSEKTEAQFGHGSDLVSLRSSLSIEIPASPAVRMDFRSRPKDKSAGSLCRSGKSWNLPQSSLQLCQGKVCTVVFFLVLFFGPWPVLEVDLSSGILVSGFESG